MSGNYFYHWCSLYFRILFKDLPSGYRKAREWCDYRFYRSIYADHADSWKSGNSSCGCRRSERTDSSDHSGNLSDRIKEKGYYGRKLSSSRMASGTWNYCSYYFCLSWNHNLCIKSGKFILSIVRTGKGVVAEAYTFF